jgi:hypothetical protein
VSGWIAALASGTVLWSIASLAVGGREAWDVPAYWTLWYPLALLLSAALGFLFPVRPWRWPIAVMLVQLPVMLFVAGGGANLLPLGVVLLLILALPAMLAAAVGAVAARRLRGTKGA